MLKFNRVHVAAIVALGLSVSATGCASMMGDTKKKSKSDKQWSLFGKKEYPVPQAVNVVWTYDILTMPGKPPTRGFGGRFYFYNEKTQAIPVEGELMVYGFDDSQSKAAQMDLSQAAKRYKFTAEQLTTHFSEGQLGASYSVWIPWDVAPGDEKKIMLIPTFIAKDGTLVKGAPATVNLPGRKQQEQPVEVMQVNAQFPLHSTVPSTNATQAVSLQRPAGQGVTTLSVPSRTIQRGPVSEDWMAAQREAIANMNQFNQSGQVPTSPQPLSAHVLTGQSVGTDLTTAPATPQLVSSTSTQQLAIKPIFTPPQSGQFPSGTNLVNGSTAMRVTGPNTNGWGLQQPGVSQAATAPATHSLPSSLQVPAGPTFQQDAYPTR